MPNRVKICAVCASHEQYEFIGWKRREDAAHILYGFSLSFILKLNENFIRKIDLKCNINEFQWHFVNVCVCFMLINFGNVRSFGTHHHNIYSESNSVALTSFHFPNRLPMILFSVVAVVYDIHPTFKLKFGRLLLSMPSQRRLLQILSVTIGFKGFPFVWRALNTTRKKERCPTA